MQPATTRTILIWAIIAISSGLSAVVGWYWSSVGAEWLTHTIDVQRKLSDLSAEIISLETGQRGYLLTQDRAYLEPYTEAKSKVMAIYGDLILSVKDYAEQNELVTAMKPLIDARIAVIDETIALVDGGKTNEAIAIVRDGRGKVPMDDLEAKIDTAQAQEQLLFQARDTSFQRQRFGLLMGLVGMLFASATLAMVSVSRERERRETVEAAARLLTTSNQELERRVIERTSEIEIEKSRVEAERERAEGLLRDVTHRIGNTLALVVGFINLHIRHATDPQTIEILTGARTRIHAIASAQRRLNVTNDLELVRIDTLIESVMEDISATTVGETEIKVEIPPLLAAAQFATSLCVLIQEFVMNAVKHAFPEGRAGKITVSLHQLPERGGVLEIADNGRGMAVASANSADGETPREGLGEKIAALLSRQFGGTIAYSKAGSDPQWPGTRVRIELPDIELVASSAT